MDMHAIAGAGVRDLMLRADLSDPFAAQENAPRYDLAQLLRLIHRRLKLVIGVVIVGTALAAFAAFYILPSYTAKALLLVGSASTADAAQPSDALIDTEVTAIGSDATLSRVLASLRADRSGRFAALTLQNLQRHMKVMQELKSRLISVTFTARSPMTAADVANRIVAVYLDSLDQQRAQYESEVDARLARQRAAIEGALATAQRDLAAAQTAPGGAADQAGPAARVADLERQLANTQLDESLIQNRQDESRQQTLIAPTARVFSFATSPERPSSARPIFVIFPAFIVSLIWGAALAILLGRFSPRLRSREEVSEALGLPCLGATPRTRRIRKASPFDYVNLAPRSAYAESLRAIVIDTLLRDSARRSVVLVASSVSGEGKTTFACSYAAYAAQVLGRALLIDLDFTRKSGVYGVRRGAPGLFDALAGACALREAVQTVGRARLDLLPLGRCPDDPLPIVAGERMSQFMRQLWETYDCVVINGPPVLDICEARVIAAMADRILLVVRRGRSRRAQVREALGVLMASAPLRGPAASATASAFAVGAVLTFASEDAQPRRNAPAPRAKERGRASSRGRVLVVRSNAEDPPSAPGPDSRLIGKSKAASL